MALCELWGDRRCDYSVTPREDAAKTQEAALQRIDSDHDSHPPAQPDGSLFELERHLDSLEEHRLTPH